MAGTLAKPHLGDLGRPLDRRVNFLSQPVEEDRSRHSVCSLKNALRLIAGKEVSVPKLAYRSPASSRLARILQLANSASHLLFSDCTHKTLVSGRQLAYLGGEVEYFTSDIFARSLRFLLKRQPFFLVPGTEPAACIAASTGCDNAPRPELHLSSHCVVVIMAHWNASPSVLHYGTCGEALAEIRRGATGLQVAASDSRISRLIPTLMSYGQRNDIAAMSVQSKLPGTPPEFNWERIDQVRELWMAGKPPYAVTARPRLSEELTEVCDAFPSYRDSLAFLKDALLRWHSKAQLRGDIAHGDFWLGNVLFAGTNITGVVDWEWARTDGVRLADVLNLLMMSYAASRRIGVAHYLRQFWSDNIDDKALKDRIDGLRSYCDMDLDDLKFLALLVWFDYLRQNTIRGRMPARSWTSDFISHTTPVIRSWLSRRR